MRDNPTWAEALTQAHHRVAIGLTDVYLGNDKDDIESLDWSACEGMETGGSHRLDIATSVVFKFYDKGIRGRWFFDVEPQSANGSGHYHIDVDRVQRLLSLLPPFPRRQFLDYLSDCANALEKSALKYQEVATNEYGTAGVLRTLASKG